MANILKGRGRAVPALWGALHSTLSAKSRRDRHPFDGPRQHATIASRRAHRVITTDDDNSDM
jgi:hypothetical protein